MALCLMCLSLQDCTSLLCLAFARKYFVAAHAKHQVAEKAIKEMRLSFPDSCQGEEKAFLRQIL